MTTLQFGKIGYFSLISWFRLVNWWQYLFESIISSVWRNSKLCPCNPTKHRASLSIGWKLPFGIASPCSPDCFHVHLCWTLLYRTHLSLHITNQSKNDSLLNWRSKKMAVEIRLILLFLVSKWDTHISSFKSNLMLFKCEKAIDSSTLNTLLKFVNYWELKYAKHRHQCWKVDQSVARLQG